MKIIIHSFYFFFLSFIFFFLFPPPIYAQHGPNLPTQLAISLVSDGCAGIDQPRVLASWSATNATSYEIFRLDTKLILLSSATPGTNVPIVLTATDNGAQNFRLGLQANNADGYSLRTSNYINLADCANHAPIGYQDGVVNASCSTHGWAFDQDSPSTSIFVHVYRDGPAGGGGTIIGAYTANVARPDVNAAFPQYGLTGNHGFNITFDAASGLFDNAPHNLYVYAIDSQGGTNPLITNSPLTITCAAYNIHAVVFWDKQQPNQPGYGIYSAGDTLLSNKTVSKNGGSPQNTNAGGETIFSGLPAGTYAMSYTADSGFELTTSSPQNVTVGPDKYVYFGQAGPPEPDIITLPNAMSTCNGINPRVSFSWRSSGAKWFEVWQLYNNSSTLLQSAAANPAGEGSFTYDYNPGNNAQDVYYQVRAFYIQGSPVYTAKTTGAVDLLGCLSIVGNVYTDVNHNGTYQAGTDTPYGGLTLTLTGQVNKTSQATWNPLGSGTYTLALPLTSVPAGYTITSQSSYSIPLGSVNETRNFLIAPQYTISGNVFIDTNRNGIKDGSEANSAAAVVNLSGDSTDQKSTNSSGNYSFSDLFTGSYTATLTLPDGYYMTTPIATSVTLGPNATINFGISNVVPPLCNSSYANNGSSVAAVWRPSNGTWYISGVSSTQWGLLGDIPAPGDFDGDGRTDFTVFRPSDTKWYIYGINGSGISFGGPKDIPVPGDYDGDSISDIAVFRPENGYWYIRTSGTGPDLSIQWGAKGDIPIPADYNNDGSTDLAVFRPSNGWWYIRGVINAAFGQAGDIPTPGDYNNDGAAELALFRPSTGTWVISSSGATTSYGQLNDTPVQGDYNGDGATDIGVWRYSDVKWYVPVLYPSGFAYGQAGDIPVPCTNPTNTFSISGNVSLDYENNGTTDDPYENVTLTLAGGGITPRTVETDASGNYIFTNVRPKGSTNYTVTVTSPDARYQINPSNPITVTVGPNKTGVNFHLVPRYHISGVIFDDHSKDGERNGGEPVMTDKDYTIHVQGNGISQDFVSSNGSYTTGDILPEGQYTVSFDPAQRPNGYTMTNPPENVTPPTFVVHVGRDPSNTYCDADTLPKGALCATATGLPFTAYDIHELNFGMTNCHPWFQLIGSNGRVSRSGGFSDAIPNTASDTCSDGAYAAVKGADTITPGIVFSSGTPSFGEGQASTLNWKVIDTHDPKIDRTSYGYMMTTIRRSGIETLSLPAACTDDPNGCSLNDLESGIYQAASSVIFKQSALKAGANIIILVNGNARFTDTSIAPSCSPFVLSVSGSIYVSPNVGGAATDRTTHITGLFSADDSFIIEGNGNISCGIDQDPDLRLNISGSVVTVNGRIQNQRTLGSDNRSCPVYTISPRLDMLLCAPEFIKYKSDVWQEVSP